MQKRKLRGFVLPTIYVLAIGAIIFSIILIGRNIQSLNSQENPEGPGTPVVEQPDENNSQTVNEEKILTAKPFTNTKVSVIKEFYEKDATEEIQKKALIFFEETYMQSTGILYSAPEAFEVVATQDGVVSNIKEDELLGMIIEIEHSSKLTTIYQSLKDVKVSVGATVKQGTVLGMAGPNKIDTTSANELMFEVFRNGKLVNPNTYFGVEIKAFLE